MKSNACLHIMLRLLVLFVTTLPLSASKPSTISSPQIMSPLKPFENKTSEETIFGNNKLGLLGHFNQRPARKVRKHKNQWKKLNRNPYDIHDYKDHPCRRTCHLNSPPKTCRYYFLAEHYSTLSEACYGCPSNKTHCNFPRCVPGDGNFRGVLTINRMMPGPSIYVCINDTIEVLLDNRMELAEGTSIHWHGLKQRGSPHMDGTALVTQCPVHAQAKMHYKFQAVDPGTHFWHAHSSIQRAEGLFGPLVVRVPHYLDPQGQLYDHDLAEHMITLNDWSESMAGELYSRDVHGGKRAEPDSILVNGIGRRPNGPEMPFPTFTVLPGGQRYRFRVMYSGVLNCPVQVSIDDHQMTMISSDGQDFEPRTVDAFFILSGERFDFVLTTKKDFGDCGNGGSFWIRFKGHGRCSRKKILQLAVLEYAGSSRKVPDDIPSYDDTSNFPDGLVLNGLKDRGSSSSIQMIDLDAVTSDNDPDLLTEKPDHQFYLALGPSDFHDPRFEPPPFDPLSPTKPTPVRPINQQINYISHRLPPSPLLTQMRDIPQAMFCNNATLVQDCTTSLCECVHRLQYSLGDLVELVLVSHKNQNTHPMHMHGHSFTLIAMKSFKHDLTVPEVRRMDRHGLLDRRTTGNPARKDTIAVHPRSVTVVRFRANNPGVWFFHCHIEFHTEVGMALILQEGKHDQFPKPPYRFPRCGSWDHDNELNETLITESESRSNLLDGNFNNISMKSDPNSTSEIPAVALNEAFNLTQTVVALLLIVGVSVVALVYVVAASTCKKMNKSRTKGNTYKYLSSRSSDEVKTCYTGHYKTIN